MRASRYTFEQIAQILDQAERQLGLGHTPKQVCESLNISEEQLRSWLDRYCGTPKMGEHITNSQILDAILPIFYNDKHSSILEHIGSCVLLQIGEEVFLLTAAHVTDRSVTGILLIPTIDGIAPIRGYLYDYLPSKYHTRDQDTEDIAYYRLDSNFLDQLDPSYPPIGLNDLLLSDHLEDGDYFTFAGYPWRKTKSSNGLHESEIVTYTGHALSKEQYEKFNYDRIIHIVIRMRKRKTYSTLYQSHQTAPHPQGISGGAVLSWPRSFYDRHFQPDLKLAGICHSFRRQDNLLVSTRIIAYLLLILRNNPLLRKYFAFDASLFA